eukprot:Amastigsp_a175319_881.p1 type:complete len:508 gc:universal Amastigsp_a175319_881:30-1553(+)
MRLLFWLGLVLAVAAMADAQSLSTYGPNIRTYIGANLVQQMADAGVQLLGEQWTAVSVPDVSGTASTAVGNIDYTLKSIWIQSIALGGVNVAFQAPSFVYLTSSSVSGSMVFQWHYREAAWPHVSDGAWATVQLSQTSLAMTLAVAADDQGRLAISVLSTKVVVGNIALSLTGMDSWVYTFLVSVFKSSVNAAVGSAIESSLTGLVTSQLEALSRSLPVRVPIDSAGYGELDMSLMAQPQVSPDSIVSYHLGLAAGRAEHTAVFIPQTPSPDLPPQNTGRLVQLEASADVFTSMAMLYAKLGLLNTHLTALPDASPLKLNVYDFSEMVPELLDYFSESQAMVADIVATSPPLFTIEPSGLGATAVFSLAFGVVDATDSTRIAPAYTLSATVELTGTATVTDAATLQGVLTFASATLVVASSAIGTIDPSTSEQVVNFALRQVAVPQLNRVLAAGIPLPLPAGVVLSNTAVTYLDSCVGVSADVTLSVELFQKLLGFNPAPPPASGSD